MTLTKKYTLTDSLIEVADSSTDSLVTIQNQSDGTIGVVVGDVIASMGASYNIPPNKEAMFSGFDGKIMLAQQSARTVGDVVVITS